MRKQPPVEVPSEKMFFQMVRAAFGQTPQNPGQFTAGCGYDKADVLRVLGETGIHGDVGAKPFPWKSSPR